MDFWTMNLHNGTFESHLRDLIDDYEQDTSSKVIQKCQYDKMCVRRRINHGCPDGCEDDTRSSGNNEI